MRTRAMIAVTTLTTAKLCAGTLEAGELSWRQLPPLPDQLGVAGAFAGVSGGALLVAGGANFPGKPPWEGGSKVWHDTVYALRQTNGEWETAGKLARPLGYGVSLPTRKGVLCIGGNDANGPVADVFLLVYARGRTKVEPMPALPLPLANAAGSMVGNVAYIAGGSDRPGEQSALNRCFKLDLNKRKPGWQEVEACPGEGRILPIAGSADGAFYLFSGAALRLVEGKVQRVYLRDSWRLRLGGKWERLADLPRPCVAGPTPAPLMNSRLLLFGGDDGSLAGFQPPGAHPGFPRMQLAFDVRSGQWSQSSEVPAPRATLPVVPWKGLVVLPSGEMRPGVRSPEVWAFVAKVRH